jgi:hypothetical protein
VNETAPADGTAAWRADGHFIVGMWQQVFHPECDARPRQCTFVVTDVGD